MNIHVIIRVQKYKSSMLPIMAKLSAISKSEYVNI